MCRTLAAPIFGILMLATMAVATTSAVLADPRDFTLENAIDVTITHVYVAPSNVMSWEEDVLGADVLAPGTTVDIHFSGFTEGACSYDIKVIAADGREGYLWAVDLCAVSLVTFS